MATVPKKDPSAEQPCSVMTANPTSVFPPPVESLWIREKRTFLKHDLAVEVDLIVASRASWESSAESRDPRWQPHEHERGIITAERVFG